VGLLETQAKPLIVQAGLVVTFSNYQGEGDIPGAVLHSIGIGSILSQIPAAGTVVPTGTKVFLAVRKN
jgi:beta-lactam-binding protein with PASTA domain